MIKNINFDNLSLGLYTEEIIRRDWNDPKRIMGVKSGRCEIVLDPFDQNKKVLKINYPKGKIGQEEDCGGAQWRLRFETCGKCTVEYKVMFPKDFNFVKGGKLPGLSGGTSPGGGKKSDGSDGFSSRIMWREGGALFQYMYWMERALNKKWGDDLPWIDIDGDKKPIKIIKGEWCHLKTEITMNILGSRDGLIKSWFNGKLVLMQNGAFKKEGAVFGIDNLNFTTFFGGNTLDWAPVKDEVVYFSDFIIKGE